jgi:flagellar hook protein FlgE
VDLTDEMPDLIVSKAGYQANLKMVSTQDEILGNLLDIVG